MIKTILQITFFLTFFFISECSGKTNKPDTLKIQDFEFKSWFGYKKNVETNHNYSLLGTGFLRSPRAGNTDSLISIWIKNHPNAMVIPVYTFGPISEKVPDSKLTYCWVVYQSDTLNIFLVRQGAVPGGTMQRPKTWKKMARKEKGLNKRPEVEVHVKNKHYQDFIDKIKTADEYARKNKLGIWAN